MHNLDSSIQPDLVPTVESYSIPRLNLTTRVYVYVYDLLSITKLVGFGMGEGFPIVLF